MMNDGTGTNSLVDRLLYLEDDTTSRNGRAQRQWPGYPAGLGL